ncbi:maltose alpha-D-glucosyltransferase [Rubrobacter indicoceani]|uniref:maltose alpha-D-glucosyltransferase n=1 Tax=Rubrobacter indicoceani TaxID=2051957 RepID=UPI001968A51F|nr:maltose alpha-D-glucosyltransferase [Rubrobacter indicoceani]
MTEAGSREIVEQEAIAGDPQWYRDAIIYHLHVKAFNDSDNNGVGDFKGLTERLDYIKELGVTAIWVMPFYPSPLRDDGYDIAEYKNVHPDYGTRRDVRAFVRRAHELGLRVITELVINHTSDQHPWFKAARNAPKGSAKRDFYVWSDDPHRYKDTRIIFTDTEASNWTWDPVAEQYFWHRFFSHQPDLNLDNPQVFKAITGVMKFWLDAGVDGLRLDAIPYLIEREGTDNENLPETHDVLKRMRSEMDANYRDRLFLAEANQWPEDVLPYFGDFEAGGDECHMAFHFPLMPRLYMAVAQEDRHPIVEIMQQTPEIPDGCQWAIFLRNHDELTLEMVTDKERDYMYETYASDPRARINVGIRRRLAPLLENDRPKIELLNSLLMSMPGTPIIYYGDELGMGDNIYLGDRDAVRTPMQWTADRNAGFSKADPQKLYLPPIMDSVYGYESINVEAQSRNSGSLLNWMKRLINVRKSYKAFGRGELEFLHPGNRRVLAYIRRYEGPEGETEDILCIANLSRSAQPVELDLSRFAGRVPVELMGGTSFPPVGSLPYFITLPGYGFYWFELSKDSAAPRWHQDSPRVVEMPVVVLPAGRQPAREIRRALPLHIPYKQVSLLEKEALANFLEARRWFAGKSSGIGRVEIASQAELGGDRLLTILNVEVAGDSGDVSSAPQLYFLPLSAGWEDETGEDGMDGLLQHSLAKLRRRSRTGLLYDALADDVFCREVVRAMGEETDLSMGEGKVRFRKTGRYKEIFGDQDLSEVPVRKASVEQSNTSVIIGERAMMKAYRRLQPGENPEIEIGRYLTEAAGFRHTPPLVGTIEYEGPDGEKVSLATLQGFVESQGDGWSYVLDYLERYLDDRTTTTWSLPDGEVSEEEADRFDADDAFFDGLMHNLGLRTGEMHAALAGEAATEDRAFAPETAGPDEVEAWAEAVQEELKQTFDLLKRRRKTLSEEALPDVEGLLDRKKEVRELVREVRDAARGGLSALKARHHGDYHLGQVLVVNNDFQIIDFEGEPARPLDERRRKHSPFRDVAGMLRSFDYAAKTSLDSNPENAEELTRYAEAWLQRTRKTFLAGYYEGAKDISPDREAAGKLTDLFVLEKALYEIRYELDNRPDWVTIPVRGILDLLGGSPSEAPKGRL